MPFKKIFCYGLFEYHHGTVLTGLYTLILTIFFPNGMCHVPFAFLFFFFFVICLLMLYEFLPFLWQLSFFMSPWAQGSGKVPLVLSLLKQWLHSGQRVSLFAFSISVLTHSNPLTFLASHKHTSDSFSLSIYLYHSPTTSSNYVIWILSLPFAVLNILESMAPNLMIKLHIPIFLNITENTVTNFQRQPFETSLFTPNNRRNYWWKFSVQFSS